MKMLWQIPLVSGETLDITIADGSRVFIVGANGSGKSALVQHALMFLRSGEVERMPAHRQTWLNSDSLDITPQSREQFELSYRSVESDPSYRYREWDPTTKIESILFDFADKEDDLARRIMEKAYDRDQLAVDGIVDGEEPVSRQLNALLSQAGLPITVQVSEGRSIMARHRDAADPYSISRMSDGERNAVILAAKVLTIKPETLLLIDEPERHLHRSIITPFLSALFEKRQDCAFIVSTHDTGVPPVGSDATVLIVSSCRWEGEVATAWDINLLNQGSDLPEDLKRAILGARRQILFVEGTAESLDIQLYSVLFPGILIMPCSGCDDVIKAVKGLHGATAYHDVEPFGLIDGDNRGNEEVCQLEEMGIYALEQYSVESLYFCGDAIEAVAGRQAESLGEDASQMIQRARSGALEKLSESGFAERMAARRCERQVRVRAQLQMPNWRTISRNPTHTISLNIQEWYEKELSIFQELLEQEDLDKIIDRYPVREGNVIDEIVRALELNRERHKKTLLSRVRSDSGLADKLRSRIGPLSKLLIQKP